VSVLVTFHCGGCLAVAPGTDALRREFRSLSGRTYGIGGAISVNSIEGITPEGWVAYDPYTFATYCPECWAEIVMPEGEEAKP